MQSQKTLNSCYIEEVTIRMAELKQAIDKLHSLMLGTKNEGDKRMIHRKIEFLANSLSAAESIYAMLRSTGGKIH